MWYGDTTKTGMLWTLSTESTPTITPVKKKDKILGMDTEDIALGLGAVAAFGVAILGFLKLQDLNVIPKPPQAGQVQSRVTIGPPPEGVNANGQPIVTVQQPPTGGVVERDPLGPNTNSVPMDLGDRDNYIDQERLAKARSSVDRINAGY